MGQEQQGQPTLLESILVGSGPGADQGAEFLLAVADWVLREEEVPIKAPVKGDLSQWIAEMCAKPIEVSPGKAVATRRRAIPNELLKQLLKQSVAILVDPRREEEKRLAQLMDDFPPADLQRLMETLRQGDSSAVNAMRTEIAQKLGPQLFKQMSPASVPALLALLSRMRAVRAGTLCLVCYKMHPLSKIAQAREGDRQAVLDLVKVDKLFLHDRCTARVIRDAELQNDRVFLGQLGRALAYKPKPGWRRACQLYLHVLFALGAQLPALPVLQLRLDPEGTRFRSFAAFEKFVERCRAEFQRLQQTDPRGHKSPKEARKNPQRK
jgi:hypothetical protein